MPKIYIAVDSLAATKLENKKPETGWGEVLSSYLPDAYEVSNHAVNGRSTKSFVDEKRFDEIIQLIQPGDIVLIQFGHNDQKKMDLLRYTDPYTSYHDNLKYMVDTARSLHAKPILITPISRRKFIYNNVLDGSTLGDYPDAMRMLSNAYKIPLIDMYQTTQALISSLGDEGSKRFFLHLEPGEHPNYPSGVTDDTHLSIEGANLIASLIALELKKYL
jgi:lysophospholipase L1-like esterase